MQKRFVGMAGLLLLPMLMTGCSRAGEKATSTSIIYGVMAAISLLILLAYCILIPKKNGWILLLFVAIPIANLGYCFLSEAMTLSSALWANRIAYLGSALLPLSMLILVLKDSDLKYPRALPWVLLAISILAFLIAASQGFLDIYYKEVTLELIDGVSLLRKVYGPWHILYTVYLALYFLAMIALVLYRIFRQGSDSSVYSIALTVIVFSNILVWLMEQLVKVPFEILSITYTISALFLLCLFLLVGKKHSHENTPALSPSEEAESSFPDALPVEAQEESTCNLELFRHGLTRLTRTERLIYGYYVEGKTTKEIMESLEIKENTLKFHNKNIYSKLGVSSRKQLISHAGLLEREEKQEQ